MAPVASYLALGFLFANAALCVPRPQVAHEAQVLSAINGFKSSITSDPKGITKSWGGGGAPAKNNFGTKTNNFGKFGGSKLATGGGGGGGKGGGGGGGGCSGPIYGNGPYCQPGGQYYTPGQPPPSETFEGPPSSPPGSPPSEYEYEYDTPADTPADNEPTGGNIGGGCLQPGGVC
ncbi:hypothetical protein AC579_272 [Pseudocercospora musae]|uniref:Uncharacterized protein n=1 Tax=Pseudocercospora musae TaxID=113226 RepID=A0A139I6B8_9PEZI|nr:hypothetical protein AC579_272 [Pseudocercospora musae]